MKSMPNPMKMGTNNPVYWSKDQIAITFPSHLSLDTAQKDIALVVDTNLRILNTHALKDTPFTLERLNNKPSLTGTPTDDFTGISLYASPTNATTDIPTMHIIVFCTVNITNTTVENAQAARDAMFKVVQLLNAYERSGQAQLVSQTTPNWLWSGVPDNDPTHGCPVTPPFPVQDGGRCGQWTIGFPMLPDELENATGAGVTVFILDAFLAPEQILFAANAASTQNTLLQQMGLGMISKEPYQAAAPAISLNYTYEIPGPEQTATTGKDIYGRLSAFPMADHGLFIAGLVRDIAPDARIECVRILNDFAVGDSATLIQVLANIEARLRAGDLQNQRVVINMSLVIGPPEADQARLGLTPPELLSLLTPLYTLMLSMAQRGAIFAISVGNDSDPRDFSMNPSGMRFNARYPAAFANDLTSIDPNITPLRAIIPVGAVNQRGEPAAYSNYPGANGIAIYGGELPRPDPWLPSEKEHKIARVDTTFPIDALRGVYSAETYPALSSNDPYRSLREAPPATQTTYPQYPATETSAWAYW
ncbi:MAG: hypothetical protein ACRDHZ_08225, partial [Ktedonobacteraceae bacterium]